MSRRFAFSAALLAAVCVALGCQGRTGIGADDFDDQEEPPVDADADAAVDGAVIEDSAVEDTATTDARPDTPRRDGWIDIFDVIPIPAEGGGVIGDCARCTRDNCGGAVNTCINDPKCRTGLACVLTTCVGGGGGGPGGFDFACITKCFGGDFKTAGEAISAFTCVIGKCGSSCGSILGGLTGGGGGGTTDAAPKVDSGVKKDAATTVEAGPGGGGGAGGSGGGTPGGMEPYAPWTEADVRALDPATRFEVPVEAFAPWASELRAAACEHKYLVCGP